MPSAEPAEARRRRLSLPLYDALVARRSTRGFATAGLSGAALADVIWAAQGVTRDDGGRACPSAGAVYPLQPKLAAWRVEGLEPGLYAYEPAADTLLRQSAPPPAPERLVAAAFEGQDWIGQAAAVVALFGDPGGLARKFAAQTPPERWQRYLWMECGAAAQNAGLAAAAAGLAMTLVSGFDDAAVARLFGGAGADLWPLALLVLGGPGD
jgi:SagB-type dehydrogenase family enzyme